jgi:hypothetical protein
VFTLLGTAIIVVLALLAYREQNKDSGGPDDNMKHTRKDIRIVVWLLAAVVFLLGVIADRIH